MNAKMIKEKAKALDYTACGIIPAEPFEEYRKALDERCEAFPESAGYYKHLYNLVNPPEGGKSIIVCTVGINQYKVPEKLAPYIGKHYLFDARLPYTEEFRARSEFETFLNNIGLRILEGGVPDRWAAAKAGVGKFGHNNFIYTPEHGSYVGVDTWTVDKILEYDPMPESVIAEECGKGCRECVSACPTAALCGELKMDFGLCIPQLVGNSDQLKPEVEEQMGLWIYGCDVCQDVCPMNAEKLNGTEEFPLLEQYEEYVRPEDIVGMDEDTYINVVNPRFWYRGEKGLDIWKKNARRALRNS